MDDRRLLELAAKAAGLRVEWHEGSKQTVLLNDIGWAGFWNPLADDGDALRLAVKLNISLTPYPVYEHPKHSVVAEVKAHAECPNALPPFRYCERCTVPCQRKRPASDVQLYNDDPGAATRRAIVRAAAAIGQAKEQAK